VATELEARTGKDARAVVLGHLQRKRSTESVLSGG
jgi:hypothetical protein